LTPSGLHRLKVWGVVVASGFGAGFAAGLGGLPHTLYWELGGIAVAMVCAGVAAGLSAPKDKGLIERLLARLGGKDFE
jgi:hypothetical protein